MSLRHICAYYSWIDIILLSHIFQWWNWIKFSHLQLYCNFVFFSFKKNWFNVLHVWDGGSENRILYEYEKNDSTFIKKTFCGVYWKNLLLKTACWLQYISCYFYWILLWIRTRNAAFFFIVGWHVLKYTVTYAS